MSAGEVENDPRWHLAESLVASLRAEHAAFSEQHLADFDTFRSQVADMLAEHEVSVDDERTLYEGLSFMSVALDLARTAHDNGGIDAGTLAAMAGLTRGIASVLVAKLDEGN